MAAGITVVYCVNDGAVMAGWAEDQGISGSIVSFLADTRAELTKALGVELTHEGPMHALGNLRCKRFAAIVDDGTITHLNVSEAEGDPAGDNDPERSLRLWRNPICIQDFSPPACVKQRSQ